MCFVVSAVDEGAATCSIATEHRAIQRTQGDNAASCECRFPGRVRGWGWLIRKLGKRERRECAHSPAHTQNKMSVKRNFGGVIYESYAFIVSVKENSYL